MCPKQPESSLSVEGDRGAPEGAGRLERASPFRRAWVTLHADTGFRLFRAHGSGSLFTAGATLEGAKTKKPTARFASGDGLETFSSWLAASPRARSDCSGLNSRRNRRGSLPRRPGGHSLRGASQHA